MVLEGIWYKLLMAHLDIDLLLIIRVDAHLVEMGGVRG